MNISTYFQKTFLGAILCLSLHQPAALAVNIYSVFNAFGVFCDIFNSRGNLNEKNTQLFNEMIKRLGLENRNIKAKNSNSWLRFIGGYHNAWAMQGLNRVYINEDWFNQMTDQEKEFLMAQRLMQHKDHIGFKWGLVMLLTGIVEYQAIVKAANAGLLNTHTQLINNVNRRVLSYNDNVIKKYFFYGINLWIC